MKIVLFAPVLALLLLSGCSEKNMSDESVSKAARSDTSVYNDGASEMLGDNSFDESENAEPDMPPFVCDEDHVKQLGRTWLSDDGILWCAMSATGAEFEFTGETLDIALKGGESALGGADKNYARFAVYVDGKRVVDELLDDAVKQVEVLRGNTETRTVRIVKLSESRNSVMGIMPLIANEGAAVRPTEKKALSIEFVGDSLTCGYGIDDYDPSHKFSTSTEDVTKAFAYRTAEKLDADMSAFAISGWGVASGYSGGGKAGENVIPKYYNSIAWSCDTFDGVDPSVTEYRGEEPDIIVVNLGTNDENYIQYSDGGEDFKSCYVDMLKMIRGKNPNAKIVLTSGMMDEYLEYLINEAMEIYTDETGDTNMYRFLFTSMNWSDMTGADCHPNEEYSDRASDELAGFIKSIL